MRQNILIYLLLFFPFHAVAQRIEGTVLDEYRNAISYASVSLVNLKDSSFITGTVCGLDGHFSFMYDKNRKTLLKISRIGYITRYIRVQDGRTLSVLLKPYKATLHNIVVSVRKPQFKMTEEGLLTRVKGTMLGKMKTASEVLMYIPGVIKNGKQFEIFGKGIPIVYVNDRKLYNLDELDNIKAEDITSVEVVQNPGANYDASVNAIIRILTTKRLEDFAVNMRSVYYWNNFNNTIQQIDFTYNHKRLNIFSMYKYTNFKESLKGNFQQTTYTDSIWNQHSDDYSTHRMAFHTVMAGIGYDINRNHSVGTRYQLDMPVLDKRQDYLYSVIRFDEKYYNTLDSHKRERGGKYPQHLLNVYYTGQIRKSKIEASSDFYLSRKLTTNKTMEYTPQDGHRIMSIRSKTYNSMIAGKLNIETSFKNGKLSYGCEYVHTRRSNNYNVKGTVLLSNSYSRLKEETISPFITYAQQTKFGDLSLGVRSEYVYFKYYENGVSSPLQRRIFKNVFPQIRYLTKVGLTSIQFSYSVKTQRPTYLQLGDNISYQNRFTFQTGNPLLKSSFIHTVEVSGVWKFLQFVLNFRNKADAIIYWSEQLPKDEKVTVIKYKNEHSIKSATAYLAVAPQIKWWSPEIRIGIIKQWYKIHTDMENPFLCRPIYLFDFNNALSLPWNMTLRMGYNFLSKGNVQNVLFLKQKHVLSITFTKSFLHDKLTLDITANNLLNKEWEANRLWGQKTVFSQWMRNNTRDVTFTLCYKFNKPRSKYKGQEAGLEERQRF